MRHNFVDNSDKAIKALKQAQTEVLKEIGKLLRKKARAKIRKYRRTGRLSKNVQTWVKKKDKPMRLQLGIKPRGFYGMFFEFKTEDMPHEPFLQDTVKENIPEIENITKKWLGKKMK